MEKTEKIYNFLTELNPNAKSELHYNDCYQFLIAVILSAQCTDKRVNEVTPTLFKMASTPYEMIKLPINQLKDVIHSCGFYNSKSKAIMESSQDIVDKFEGIVPSDLESLTSLRGVGRKTANLVLNICYNKTAIAVDTHVLRVSKRLELCKEEDDPLKCEQKLEKSFSEVQKKDIHHKMVLFGRYICKAKNPICNKCELQKYCKYYKMNVN